MLGRRGFGRLRLSVLLVDDVRKTFAGGEAPVEAVRGVSLTLERGDFVALMGPSGCGKSTLLHLSGAMDRPTSGRILVDGTDVASLDDDALTRLRRERIGFVFQFFNLLPTLTVLENAALPLLLAGLATRDAESRAQALIDRVGLGHRAGHYPQQISGGEMQRAAIARAVVHEPALLVADEPTGNLDSENGGRILELLVEINRDLGVTILLATHALETASITRRIVRMRDGQLVAEAAG
ncbi:MAG: ABC transporter ATP-binding protein [Blastocatellia bacterium]|nr:ABC transporter ATP-binding protein [Blastocatellia bacterium]